MKDVILALVVPCYNEADVLGDTTRQLTEMLNNLISVNLISEKSFIFYVNDGSNDDTWKIIECLNNENALVGGVSLSKNVGHQNALIAGLMNVKDMSDIVISIDADLQNDITTIPKMIKKYEGGCDIVYGVRTSRDTDSLFKKITAICFHKLMKKLGVNLIYNHADYRLMSKRSIDALSLYKEKNLFLRGLVPLLGFKSDQVYYTCLDRMAGNSKYTFSKMFNLALNGIVSFSEKPLHFIFIFGSLSFLFSFIYICWMIIGFFIGGRTIVGWTSIIVSIWLFGSLNLIALGLIGEYIGKIFIEVKGRPLYNVDRIVMHKNIKK